LAAYWLARDRFIESGRDVRPSPRVQEMLAQVREPLLSVLRVSPDFRPAYDPLLAMATALAGSDPSGARTLLNDLAQIQPARVEAAQTLLRLFH
jgi:spermidine synthase